MKGKAIVVGVGVLLALAGWGVKSYADEMLGGEPKEFSVAILADRNISFILPSTIIVDEKAKRQPLELIVTNDTKSKHGFAIEKLRVKEILKPGETKKITVPVMDLDSLGGTEQSAYRIYDPLNPKTVGGQLFVRR
jgi:hypothetical protein